MTYVDGFSGPWETQTEDFADSSFMIAIGVLKDAQQKIQNEIGERPRVRCFFSEEDPEVFAQLTAAVAAFNKPQDDFEIRTFCGKFEDAISDIQAFVGVSFSLIFIDPTGWTGYPLKKIRPLFTRRNCEVLINFMYDFVNRAASMSDPKTVASLDPILGGPNWEERLDSNLPRGRAVEKLFRDTLRRSCGFDIVVSTKIDRSTTDRPHFFVVYGTNSPNGLKAFRETEYVALRAHARNRADAKERRRESKLGLPDLFAGVHAAAQESTIDEVVEEQMVIASNDLLHALALKGELKFSKVIVRLLQAHALRETNVKDICLGLAKAGKIENTWGPKSRKPHDNDLIRLTRVLPSG